MLPTATPSHDSAAAASGTRCKHESKEGGPRQAPRPRAHRRATCGAHRSRIPSKRDRSVGSAPDRAGKGPGAVSSKTPFPRLLQGSEAPAAPPPRPLRSRNLVTARCTRKGPDRTPAAASGRRPAKAGKVRRDQASPLRRLGDEKRDLERHLATAEARAGGAAARGAGITPRLPKGQGRKCPRRVLFVASGPKVQAAPLERLAAPRILNVVALPATCDVHIRARARRQAPHPPWACAPHHCRSRPSLRLDQRPERLRCPPSPVCTQVPRSQGSALCSDDSHRRD